MFIHPGGQGKNRVLVLAVLFLFIGLGCTEMRPYEVKGPAPEGEVPPEYQNEIQDLKVELEYYHQSVVPEVSPHHAGIHFRLGEIYFEIGDMKAAEEHLIRSSQMAPEEAQTHLYLGRLFSATRRDLEAVDEFKLALKLDPDGFEVYEDLGDAYHRLEMIVESEAAYRQYDLAVKRKSH